jgi:hypothetical protein
LFYTLRGKPATTSSKAESLCRKLCQDYEVEAVAVLRLDWTGWETTSKGKTGWVKVRYDEEII